MTCRIRQRRLDRGQMRLFQIGVGVKEDNNVRAGGGRAEIHLFAAIRSRRSKESCARRQRDPFRFSIARCIHHDGFGDTLPLRQLGQERCEIFGVAPRRHHHADPQKPLATLARVGSLRLFQETISRPVERAAFGRSQAVNSLLGDLVEHRVDGFMNILRLDGAARRGCAGRP